MESLKTFETVNEEPEIIFDSVKEGSGFNRTDMLTREPSSDSEISSNYCADQIETNCNGDTTEKNRLTIPETTERASLPLIQNKEEVSQLKRSRRKASMVKPIVLKKDKHLTEEQLQEILTSFTIIDANGDGRISRLELFRAACVIGLNPTDKDVDEMMRQADLNGDGFIDFHEYKNMMKRRYVSTAETIDLEQERLIAAFKVLDRDDDGFLSTKELKYALSFRNCPLDDAEIDSILQDADANGDGLIDYEEFTRSKLCKSIFM